MEASVASSTSAMVPTCATDRMKANLSFVQVPSLKTTVIQPKSSAACSCSMLVREVIRQYVVCGDCLSGLLSLLLRSSYPQQGACWKWLQCQFDVQQAPEESRDL